MVKSKQMDWRVLIRSMLMIALPIAFQNLLSTTASMVDTIMIGSQGELAVAAVGICSQISSLFYSCYFGFAGGAMMFFSQYWGAKNEKGINKTFGVSMAFILVISLLFGGLAVMNPEFIMRVYTDKENIVKLGAPYMRIVGFAYPLQAIAVLISLLMRSTERITAPLIGSVAALITNFILNWILIYGRFGAPKMGAAGAAVGTLVSGMVNVLILLGFLKKTQNVVKMQLKEMFSWEGGFVRDYLGKCLPIFCNEMLYGVGQMIINIVIGRQAESAIAAMAAFRVLEGFVFAFFGGLADAGSVLVGKEVGAGYPMKGYQYMKGFAVICPAITFTICLIGLIFNRPLFALFGLGADAMNYGKYMICIYLVAGTMRTCNYIMNCCYRAGGETIVGSVLEVGCLFAVSVPATWIAGMVLHLPFLAVFAFIYTDEIIRLIFELWYTRSGKWIKPVTKTGKAAMPEFWKEFRE